MNPDFQRAMSNLETHIRYLEQQREQAFLLQPCVDFDDYPEFESIYRMLKSSSNGSCEFFREENGKRIIPPTLSPFVEGFLIACGFQVDTLEETIKVSVQSNQD